MIGVIIAWSMTFFLATVFQCGVNWSLNWAPIGMFLTQCSNTLNMLTVFTATDIITDLIIIFMPVPMVCERLARAVVAKFDFPLDLEAADERSEKTGHQCYISCRILVSNLAEVSMHYDIFVLTTVKRNWCWYRSHGFVPRHVLWYDLNYHDPWSS